MLEIQKATSAWSQVYLKSCLNSSNQASYRNVFIVGPGGSIPMQNRLKVFLSLRNERRGNKDCLINKIAKSTPRRK